MKTFGFFIADLITRYFALCVIGLVSKVSGGLIVGWNKKVINLSIDD